MIEVQPPTPILHEVYDPSHSIFLAGSIEMGTAEDWQKTVIKDMQYYRGHIFNPRRNDWDSSWKQSIHDPQFREQVEWELEGLRFCKTILFYFDPATKSPISLMELGYVIGMMKPSVIVICPKDFYRKGNVDIICRQYSRSIVYTTLQEGIDALKVIC